MLKPQNKTIHQTPHYIILLCDLVVYIEQGLQLGSDCSFTGIHAKSADMMGGGFFGGDKGEGRIQNVENYGL